MKYYCDGGGFNGEHSRWGIVDENKSLIMYAKIFGHDSVTNNVAEYSAVINALVIAKDGDIISSDSQVVIYQLTGKYTCKADHLKPLQKIGLHLLSMKNVRLMWEPRNKNLAGKFLDSYVSKYNKVV